MEGVCGRCERVRKEPRRHACGDITTTGVQGMMRAIMTSVNDAVSMSSIEITKWTGENCISCIWRLRTDQTSIKLLVTLYQDIMTLTPDTLNSSRHIEVLKHLSLMRPYAILPTSVTCQRISRSVPDRTPRLFSPLFCPSS